MLWDNFYLSIFTHTQGETICIEILILSCTEKLFTFAVPVRIREGLVPSEIGMVYIFDLCHVLLFRVQLLVYALSAGSHSPELFPSLDTVTIGAHGTHAMVIRMSQWAPGLHV